MNLKDMVPNLPADAPDIGEVLLQTADISWREKSLKGYTKKCSGATRKRCLICLNSFRKGRGNTRAAFSRLKSVYVSS